ncbi:toll/interleukin-1 receptor domain-containing protein [Actinoallomurus spadix]|uniref:TIR domain-containing protein n=1 Tax=Actinoallomurus spadix TaxID=79912 RepID=A0ABP3GMV5_9ACTN|nr:toll/interleukin-1 receptor domain-containing protein [Actinoallomurus spadix]MCO5991608.1 toll/interleukin-1 receptor domain-containing protein [Actinoallomurus spadix]
MEAAGLIFTAVGTVAGVVAAYYAWIAVRPRRRSRADVSRSTSSAAAPGTGKVAGSVYDAFVSYSHDDADWVTRFVERLEDDGFRVARDEVVFKPGDVLVHAVEQAIRDSAHGILVFSPASMASGWVKQEYATLMQRSIENGRRFIPLVIEDVKLPEFAATRYYADFRHVSDAEYDRLIVKVSEALRNG